MWRPSKQQHYWERSEYWEESWRLEETCCHSNSSGRPSTGADVKNSKGVKNDNNNCSKKILPYSWFCRFSGPRNEKQRKQKEKKEVLRPHQRTEKIVEHEGNGDTCCDWRGWNGPLRLGKGAGRDENQEMNRGNQNYCMVKIDQNTEKSHGDLRRLAIIQSPGKGSQLTLVRKTCKENNNNNNREFAKLSILLFRRTTE